MDELLRGIAHERARIIAPVVTLAVLAALIVSEPLGISLAPAVIAWNLVALGGLTALSFALRHGRIHMRSGHHLLIALWATPVIGTIVSGVYTDISRLWPLLFVEVLAVAVLLRVRDAVVLLLLLDGVLLEKPFAARDLFEVVAKLVPGE